MMNEADPAMGMMSVEGLMDEGPLDPMVVVEQAKADGVASNANDLESRDVAQEKAALVAEWWKKTAETKDFSDACVQYERDLETLNGGTDQEVEDEAEITINHVYRNAIQGVAMTVPELSSIEWKPKREVAAVAGFTLPPQMKELLQQRRVQQLGLAECIGVLFTKYADQCDLQEKIEAIVQDAFHFRMSVLKVWWQSSLADDPISTTRLPDEQDLLARARVEIEAYDRGDFTKNDARYQRLRENLQSIGKTEADILRGIMVELVPLRQYRIDSSVSGPEYKDSKKWERQDVMMRRADILAEWPDIRAEDLNTGHTYTVDATGIAVRQEKINETDNAGSLHRVDKLRDATNPSGEDWMLVAEIYDYETNTRLVLVEGLEYPAVEVPLERSPVGMSPFVLLIVNRRPGKLRGFSDTELQAKTQRLMNKKRTMEEDSKRAAQPRFGFAANGFPDASQLERAANAAPGSFTKIDFNGKAEDFQKAIFNLAGNHDHNPAEFDRQPDIQDLRKMAMLPEQASGELGGAQFATEVQVAAAGANALARFRQTIITRFLKKLGDKIAQLILLNVPKDLAIEDAGPLAQFFYPDTPMDRQTIYKGLMITTQAKMDKALDYSKRAEALARLIEAFRGSGIKFDQEMAAKVLAKFMDLDEATDMISADPNELVARLVDMIQKDPGGLAPQSVMALAQIGQLAQQQVMQMQAQQQPTNNANSGVQAPMMGA